MTRRHHLPRWAIAGLVGLVSLLAAACSSVTRPAGVTGTVGAGPSGAPGVAQQGNGAGANQQANGAGATQTTLGASGTASKPAGGGPGTPSVSVAPTGTDLTGGGTAGQTPGGEAPPNTGVGVSTGPSAALPPCTTPIKLGVSYSSDEANAERIVGTGNANEIQSANYMSNLQSVYQLGANDINARGGIANCKVVLAFHNFAITAGDGWDAEAQAECADFADDKHVFAVFPTAIENRTLASCLAQKHVPLITGGTNDEMPSTADIAKWSPYYYAPDQIGVDELSTFPTLLNSAGFFSPGSRVGILIATDGTGDQQALASQWKTELAALHIPVVATFSFPFEHSFDSVATGASQMASAVLSFKGAKVDHILATPDGGNAVVLFTDAEGTQNYAPHLALNTFNVPSVLIGGSATANAGAMVESFSLGDLIGQATKPANPANAFRDHCQSIYTRVAAADGFDPNFLLGWCDALNFLQQALAGTSGQPTPAQLQARVAALGTSFTQTAGYSATSFAPGRMHGPTGVRILSFNVKTNGFAYASPVEQIP